MLETRNPIEVLTTLRTAERLLCEQAELLRRQRVRQTDAGDWGPTGQYRQLLDTAADLGALAAEIAREANWR